MSAIPLWQPRASNSQFVPAAPIPGTVDYFTAVAKDAFYHSPFMGIQRMTELFMEETNSFGLGEKFESLSSGPLLDKDEANRIYGIDGQLSFDSPIYQTAARYKHERKRQEIGREYVIQHGTSSVWRMAGSFGVGLLATAIDPINLGSMFFPVIGSAKAAQSLKAGSKAWGGVRARVALGLYDETKFNQKVFEVLGEGVTRRRIAKGVIEGSVGAAVVEPFVLTPAWLEDSNYNLKDTMMNFGFSAILGATLHAGFGKISDSILQANYKTHANAHVLTISQTLNDQPNTVGDDLISLDPNVIAAQRGWDVTDPADKKKIGEVINERGKKLSELRKEEQVRERVQKPDTPENIVTEVEDIEEMRLNPDTDIQRSIDILGQEADDLELEFRNQAEGFKNNLQSVEKDTVQALDDFEVSPSLGNAQKAARSINRALGDKPIKGSGEPGQSAEQIVSQVRKKIQDMQQAQDTFSPVERSYIESETVNVPDREKGIKAGIDCIRGKVI